MCLYVRPRRYWPTHTQVSFTGHLNGVEAAPGVYGHHTLTQTFTVGSFLNVVASTAGQAGALENREVFADSLPGDGQAVSERGRCRLASLEQEIEKPSSRWLGYGGDQLDGIDGGRAHRLYSSWRRNQVVSQYARRWGQLLLEARDRGRREVGAVAIPGVEA